jgi:hypothetical protein
MATILMLDGGEHGRVGFSGASGVHDAFTGTPLASTATVRTGLSSLRNNPAGAAENVQYNLAASLRIVMQAVYFRFNSLPTADGRIMEFNNASGNGNVWFSNATDQVGLSIGGGAITVGGPTLVANTWYRLVVEYDTSTGTYSIKARVDNGTEFSTTTAIAAADQSAVRLGTNGAHTYDCFYDDWIISVTAGDYAEIGGWTSHEIESLIPSSDGTHNITTAGDFDSFVGTAFDNTTTTGFSFIDHRPLQVANTADQVIRQELGTTANYMEFGLENHTLSGTPLAARAYATHVEAASAGASLGEARLLLADDTEVLTTGSISVINSTEDPGLTVTIRKRMCIDPSGGWDNTKVDGLKARVGFADNAPDVNFIDFMVEVLYFTAAITAVSEARPTFEPIPFMTPIGKAL